MKSDTINKLAIGCLFLQSVQVFAAEEASKPNIILIMTDQQSYNMISALQNTYTSTPNLDRLVQNGISFTNTFCTNPVSVASRFSIFTGMYGGQYQIRDNQCVDAVQADVLPVLTKYGMGNIFKNNGYETVYGGKVHLPFAKNTSKFSQPVNYGFSTYLTDDERDILGTTAANFIKNRTSTTPLLLVVSFLNPHDICLESSTNLSKDVVVDPTKPEIAATISAIRAQAAAYDSVYFYNNIAPQLPANYAKTNGFPSKFTPLAFDNFPDYYWRKYRWIYNKLVQLVDSHIGVVLNAIDTWSQKNNTIVIFTSDHGEMQAAHHATVKNLPFNECQKVPFIISGRGIVANQRDTSIICNGTDIIPTMCELAGIAQPTGMPGVSVAKRALGTGTVTQRKYLYLEGDGFSNIVENPGYKYTQFNITGTPEMLIDLKNDPGELNDVSTMNSSSRSKTTELRNVLSSTVNTVGTITSVRDVHNNSSQSLNIITNAKNGNIIVSGIDVGFPVEIYSMTGAMQFATNAVSETIVIETAHFADGIYLIHNKNKSSKLIINN